MRRESWIALFLVGLLLAASGAVADWPGFRGPNHDGSVPEARLFDDGAAALAVGWKRELGSGYSAVAVADGRAFAMFAADAWDVIAAFDTDTGDELWRYRIAETYDGHDGSHDGPISTPLVAGEQVYGLSPWGHLFAVDAATGREVWTTHLVDDQGSKKPHYGFTTSPLVADGVLVIELGAEDGKTIAGFDPRNGALVWTAGDDTIEYHSPIVATLAGRKQVIAAGKDHVRGVDARTGDVLWSHEHAGDERAMGGMTIVPVPAGDDRLFLMNKIDSSVMLRVSAAGDEYSIEELWSGNAIKSSYVVPVYHEGHLYGMSNRIFVCVDAATGEIAWRSREPGDGFPTRVGDHLVILTKPGTLHVAEASPAGYRELARLDLFDEHSWSGVAYDDGHLYARSMSQLARIDTTSGASGDGEGHAQVSGSAFDRLVADVERARDKGAVVDAFLAAQPSFPIVEDDGTVHFLYRGNVADVGIVGDMIGYRREDPMKRLAGTNLFHYATRLEPDAAVTYGFIPDYGEPVADPLNPLAGDGLFGEVSYLAMPAWQAPDFLEEAAPARRGRLETVEWESAAREGRQRSAQVYLPVGYDAESARRYPVLYVHHGQEALDSGKLKHALDRLIGKSVAPLIAVFVIADAEDPRADLRDREAYSRMVVEELLPEIDATYRTLTEPMARASVGSGRAAAVALQIAFEHPELFARTGGQSALVGADDLMKLAPGPDEQPMVIYLDWGTYHMRSPHEAWDLAESNRELWSRLREAGYRPAGGELPEGFGWACWSGHTDELLAAMFPRRAGRGR